MATILKTTRCNGSWEGVPGTLTTYNLEPRRLGRRIVVMEQAEKQPLVRLITGDGRTEAFEEIQRLEVPADQLDATVEQLAAAS